MLCHLLMISPVCPNGLSRLAIDRYFQTDYDPGVLITQQTRSGLATKSLLMSDQPLTSPKTHHKRGPINEQIFLQSLWASSIDNGPLPVTAKSNNGSLESL